MGQNDPKNILKCIVGTRGVFSYNIDVELGAPTYDFSTRVSAISVVRILKQRPFYNPLNFYPSGCQRVGSHSSISFLRDRTTSNVNPYLSNDFVIQIYSSANDDKQSMHPLGFFTAKGLGKLRGDLPGLSPQIVFFEILQKQNALADTPDKFGVMLNIRQSEDEAFLVNEFNHDFEWIVDDITKIDVKKGVFKITSMALTPTEQKLSGLVVNLYKAKSRSSSFKWLLWVLIGILLIGVAAAVVFYFQNKENDRNDSYDPIEGAGGFSVADTDGKWNMSNGIEPESDMMTSNADSSAQSDSSDEE
jgi:hypothetical protein